MNVLVIGMGSIGQRHARILREDGHRVGAVSRRPDSWDPAYPTVAAALDAMGPVGYVVVATETSDHGNALDQLARADYRGLVLVEKPLFSSARPLPENRFEGLFVGYNLRFHSLVRQFRAIAMDGGVACATLYAGQHLAQWRKGTDYRDGYSARRALGGGVLRDLSHELDYALWALGDWRRVAALGGRVGGLEIDSEDAVTLLLEAERCPILSVHLNYLHVPGKRTISAHSRGRSYEFDLVGGLATVDGETTPVGDGIAQTYKMLHSAVLEGRHETLCTANEGLDVVKLIEAAELSIGSGNWARNT